MRRLIAPSLILGLLVAAVSPLAASEDPRKEFLKGVGSSFKSGNAEAIARYFPETRKVELRLRGVKAGRYRSRQARSLLTTYFGETIQPIKYELKEVRGSMGKFTMEYRVRADGRRVKGTTCVYIEKADSGWLIVGIVEY